MSAPTAAARGALAGRTELLRGAAIAVLVAAGAALIVLAATTEGFFTVDNLRAILADCGIVGIAAIGMTAIVLGGSLFSLSLGTTIAVCAMAFMALLDLGAPAAIVLTILLGAALVGVQGLVVGAVDANPIIVTIAAGELLQGAATLLSDGEAVDPPPGASFHGLRDTLLGVPISVYAMLALAVVVHLLFTRTRFGRELRLVGDNRRAARIAPLRVGLVTTLAFALMGACAALAGVFVGAQAGSATLLLSGTYTYDAIAAVLIGGTLISGGRGSALRTVGGVLVVAVISDLLLLRGFSTGTQIALKGAIVLAVVVLVRRPGRTA